MAYNVLEGEPFGTVEFCIECTGCHLQIQTLDVGLKAPLIGGHKQDLAEMFNLEGREQTWIYNGITLEDNMSLWDYGIHGDDTPVITVTIS